MIEESKLLNRVDFRQVTIEQLNHVLNVVTEGDGKKINILFLTNFGLIQGEITDPFNEAEDYEPTFFQSVIKRTIEFRSEAIAEAEENNAATRAVNDGAYIPLKNVVIKHHGSAGTLKIQEMILFTEHIVGISFSDSSLE
ncbi:hypothetical protein RE628_20460 [Paenibacillus sp. D2_2]|uniref:hypothetical protein n=1 Tax=Paenibacillus sp. D2_2 TaxID=3073092 RepID=UPI00281503CD|nr:hypothetical protein [Paenibacillus sp. D2_2]WMT39744.1 hypothetical protein RE628_20460 [Paenibacillus sp. D2_2]